MPPTIPDVSLPAETVAQILALPPAELARLADYLTAATSAPAVAPPAPDDVREAWRTELGRRIDAYLAGEVKANDAKESIARIRSEFRKEFGYEA